jgi:hypothetical protein
MIKEIANFFWDGELTQLEKSCINSFVKNNFDVRLWSYNNLQLDGVESCDASLILDKMFMYELNQSFRQGDLKKAKVTAFSDLFRYTLLSKHDGWWFDTDCYCLKDASFYKELREGKKVTAAFIEKGQTIGVGALYIDRDISKLLIDEFNSFIKDNKNGNWGVFGPDFFTYFVNAHGITDDILYNKIFYEIHWSEFHYFTNPQLVQVAIDRIKNSYLTHIWNTEFALRYLDKNNPPKGSLLNQLFGAFS